MTWFFIEDKLAAACGELNPLMILAASLPRFEIVSRCLIAEAVGLNTTTGFLMRTNYAEKP